MKKLFACMLALAMLLTMAACAAKPEEAPAEEEAPAAEEMPAGETVEEAPVEEEPAEEPAEEAPVEEPAEEEAAEPAMTIFPLPTTIDLENLTDCTVAISLEEGDVYVDDTGALQMDVTVYTYDLYDMVDMAMLEEGFAMSIGGEEILIETLERSDTGMITINGGLEQGGHDFITDDSGVFFELLYNDARAYYPLGEITLQVNEEFIYTDASDLDADPVEYYPGDFVTEGVEIEYHFVPNNTQIVIQDGQVIAMTRNYIP